MRTTGLHISWSSATSTKVRSLKEIGRILSRRRANSKSRSTDNLIISVIMSLSSCFSGSTRPKARPDQVDHAEYEWCPLDAVAGRGLLA
uniref:Uncharacterized protein n=1 Tax=Arundo donax TaxID=35708 RepID=A0A0A9G8Y0_ARUDO